jgi:DNA-directed RNA polymerase subunit RPC12/RpoP
MLIVYRCPGCGKRLRAAPAAAGTETPCPGCGTGHRVPAEDSPEAQIWGNTVRAVVERRPSISTDAAAPDRDWMQFPCEHCNQVVTAMARKAGQSILCPKCGRRTAIPPSEPVAALAPPATAEPPRETEEEARRRAAEEEARRLEAERLRREAEAAAQAAEREAAERARRAALLRIIAMALEAGRLGEARRQAAEEQARREAEERARRQAEDQARREAEERARQESEQRRQAAHEVARGREVHRRRMAREDLEHNPPMIQPAVSLAPIPPHLIGERHDPATRRRLLQRLRECFDRGQRDPELLYLGGRFAASLGLEKEACRFLDPLDAVLRDGGRPAAAFFPVGLLYLEVLPAGERRDGVLRDLRALAAGSAKLAAVLLRAGHDPQGRLLAGSPQRLLRDVEENHDGRGEAVLPLFQSAKDGSGTGPGQAARLARFATDRYRAGDAAPARRALETLLVSDGDQPDVLRNLITVTGEQGDAEAQERYWRRYVKVLLWHVLRGERPEAAWEDLTRFYLRVATLTDRQFGEALPKTLERLRLPGLLPRWLEAHAALVWLDSIPRGHRRQQTTVATGPGRLALMRYWVRVFYPEFTPYLDIGRDEAAGVASRARTRLSFDPGLRLLSRFVEWAKAQFALKNEDGDQSPHVQAVTALAGCAARIPLRPYLRELTKIVEADELTPQPFRRTFQEMCSLLLMTHLKRLLDDKDWKGLLARFGDEEIAASLTPMLRLFAALAHCHAEQPAQALDVACQTFAELQPDDVGEDSQCVALWKNVLHANLNSVMKAAEAKRAEALAPIERKLQELPDLDHLRQLKQESLADVRELIDHIRLQERINEVIAKSQELVKDGKFAEAVKLVKGLPDSPEEVKKLKKSLLEQLGEAEKSSGIQKQIDEVIEKVKKRVEQEQFENARQDIRRLPDKPEDVKKLKKNLLDQVNEAEQAARVGKQIEEAMKKVQDFVNKDRFEEARQVIRGLPDKPENVKKTKQDILKQIVDAEESHRQVKRFIDEVGELVKKGQFDKARQVVRRQPENLKELKQNILRQIDESEEMSGMNRRIDQVLERTKGLVQEGKFDQARKAVRELPNAPAELSKLKDNVLDQIKDVENKWQEATRENMEILQRLGKKRVDMAAVLKCARDNNVNVANQIEFNALLQAIDRQV